MDLLRAVVNTLLAHWLVAKLTDWRNRRRTRKTRRTRKRDSDA